MRILFWSAFAAVALLDAGATVCAAVLTVIEAVAWALGLPFSLIGSGFLALSRRLIHGAAGLPASPHQNGTAVSPSDPGRAP